MKNKAVFINKKGSLRGLAMGNYSEEVGKVKFAISERFIVNQTYKV